MQLVKRNAIFKAVAAGGLDLVSLQAFVGEAGLEAEEGRARALVQLGRGQAMTPRIRQMLLQEGVD